MANHYCKKDERIKAFSNKNRLGQFRNRNEIAGYANGKYLKFLDSDDMIYPFGIEQLVYYMEMFPDSGYGLCSIDQDNERMFPYCLDPKDAYFMNYFDKPIFHKAPLSSIIKRDIFTACGGFPYESVSGDFAMWNYLSQLFPVVLMPHGIVWYRIHTEQEMQKTRENVSVQFDYLKVEEFFLNHSDCPLMGNDKLKAIRNNNNKIRKFIFWKLRSNGIRTFFKLLKENRKIIQLDLVSSR